MRRRTNANELLVRIADLGYRLECSLASYLRFAVPWRPAGVTTLRHVLMQISDEDRQCAEQLSAIVLERGGALWPRTFPTRFTSFNDLHIEYVAFCVLEEVQELAHLCKRLLQQVLDDEELEGAIRRIRDLKCNQEALFVNALAVQLVEPPIATTVRDGETDTSPPARRRRVALARRPSSTWGTTSVKSTRANHASDLQPIGSRR